MKLSFNCPIDVSDLSNNACDLCSRTLIDCTSKSTNEIQSLAQGNNKFCGIFKSSQINNREQSHLTVLFKLAFMWVFVLGLNSAKASDVLVKENYQTIEIADSVVTDSTKTYPKVKIHIHDKNLEPLPFTKVSITKSNGQIIYAVTDFDGNVILNGPNFKDGEILILEVRCIGYQSLIVKNVIVKNELTIDLKLESTENFLLGYVIIDVYPALIPKDPYDFNKTTINPNQK